MANAPAFSAEAITNRFVETIGPKAGGVMLDLACGLLLAGLARAMRLIQGDRPTLGERIGAFFGNFGMRPSYAMAGLALVAVQGGVILNLLGDASENADEIRALVAQAVWASVLVVSGSFDTLTDYAMFAILGFVGMATASVFVFRRMR